MLFCSKIKILGFIVILHSLGATFAYANDLTSPLNAIYSCTPIKDSLERLACFDKHVSALKFKEEKKEIITITAKQAKAVERDSFGFSLPSLPKLGLINSNTDKSKKSAQTFKVETLTNNRNRIILKMENGQIWQKSSSDAVYIPKGNLTAQIKPAAFGSFFVSLTNDKGQSSSKGIRVKRIK